MADTWEDWEDADEPVVPGAPAAAAVNDPVKSKFADEDQEEDEPKWKANVPSPQQASLVNAAPCPSAAKVAAGGRLHTFCVPDLLLLSLVAQAMV